jgi:hypothetical protein
VKKVRGGKQKSSNNIFDEVQKEEENIRGGQKKTETDLFVGLQSNNFETKMT